MTISAEISTPTIFSCELLPGGSAVIPEEYPKFVSDVIWQTNAEAGIPISGSGYTFQYANGYDVGSDFTVQIHVKINGFSLTNSTVGEYRSGLVWKHSGNANTGYALYAIAYPSASQAGVHLRFGAGGTGELLNVATLSLTFQELSELENEYDIAFAISGGKVYGYLNGELQFTEDVPSTIDKNQILRLGAPGYSWFPYNSTVYSFLGYNRALSTTEIAQNAIAGWVAATPQKTIYIVPGTRFWAQGETVDCKIYGNISGAGYYNGSEYRINYAIGNSVGVAAFSSPLMANGLSEIPDTEEQKAKAKYIIDNIDISAGTVTHYTVDSHTFDGTETITKSGNRYLYIWPGETNVSNDDINCYCPTMPERSAQDIYSNRDTANYVGIGGNSSRQIVIIDNTQSWASASAFKEYLSTLDPPLTVYYVKMKTTESISTATINTKANKNNCEFTGGNAPGFVEISGKAKEVI